MISSLCLLNYCLLTDHISLTLNPSYKPVVCRNKPAVKTVQVWSEEADTSLQDCSESTVWEVFSQGANLEEYTSNVLDYNEFCTETVLSTKTIKLLRARDTAFRSGDMLAYRTAQQDLKKDIKEAKGKYRQHIEGHFENQDPGACEEHHNFD